MEEQLRDIHIPLEIKWAASLGHQMLALIGLLAVVALVIALYLAFRQTAKKQALSLLELIKRKYDETHDAKECVASLSVLLRRVAITRDKRLAGLTGELWMQHLDPEGSGNKEISDLLLSGPYCKRVESDKMYELIALCKRYISKGKERSP
jgi:hypothetical protein